MSARPVDIRSMTMKRLDKGHLHPKLEIRCVPVRNRTRASTVRGEHSRKKAFEQLVYVQSEHLDMSPRQDHLYKTCAAGLPFLCISCDRP
jgi:hypothetical protein